MANRPPRLPNFAYSGLHRYFVTGGTHRRQQAFADAAFASVAQAQLLRCAEACGFAVLAYCLMPDHAHALVEARHPEAQLREFWRRWRQHTGFTWRRITGRRLWQEGYWDRVLREGECPLGIAAYVVHNPVRAGLVASPSDYPWLGSSEYPLEVLIEAVQLQPPGRGGGGRA